MSKETIDDIVSEMMDEGLTDASFLGWVGTKILHYARRIKAAHLRECEALREERNRAGLTARKKLAPRIRELEAENAQLRAALAKISAVTMRHYAARDLGDKGRRAIAEIMSACRFPDGALDEYERAFAENDLLRAAMNIKTEEPAK